MKKWHQQPKAPLSFKKQFSQHPDIILDLLYQRGLRQKKEIESFLNPDYEKDLHEPLLMKDMKKVRDRLIKAIKQKEKIAIFGDYDVDGVCSAALLNNLLNLFEIRPEIYIPGRVKEGYGLNAKAVQQLADKDVKLIITVDCGVTDFEEIDLANQLGVEVIVLDHHYVKDHLPAALAIVDPWQKDCQYPFKGLAGVGVVFKLAQAFLNSSFARRNKKLIPQAFDRWLLDLVALGTVVDCMPLLNENRTIVKYGLIVLAQTQRIGLQVLMRVAGIQPTVDARSLTTNLDSYCLGFILGPRLNAAGRMSHANTAYELLVCQSSQEAEFLAKRLNQKNQERQAKTDQVLTAVEGRLKKAGPLAKIIFEGDAAWPLGVNGLVAGRLADKYCRPSFIYQIEDKLAIGSGRSISGFNMIKALGEVRYLLLEFGGHAGAAGFSLDKEKLPQLKKALTKVADKKLKPQDLIPQTLIDVEIEVPKASWQTYCQIQSLAPFGRDNPLPQCLMENLEVINIGLVGNGSQHLRLDLKAEDKGQIFIFRAIGFNFSDWAAKLKLGDKIDLVFELLADDWRGPREVQLKIVDLRFSENKEKRSKN